MLVHMKILPSSVRVVTTHFHLKTGQNVDDILCILRDSICSVSKTSTTCVSDYSHIFTQELQSKLTYFSSWWNM